MARISKIEWTHHTASPWFGCTEVSPGCVHCYARELTVKAQWAGWGDNSPRVRSKGFWKDVYKWDAAAKAAGEQRRIFTSLMDWLDAKVPIEWFADFMQVVFRTPNLTWLLLTKRPELWRERLELAIEHAVSNHQPFEDLAEKLHGWLTGEWVPENIWNGVTIEDKPRIDERADILLKVPAKIRWVSAEPLLESLPIADYMTWDPDAYRGLKPPLGEVIKSLSSKATKRTALGMSILKWRGLSAIRGIDWMVVGGESGRERRDCGIEAITDLVQQCTTNRIPVFVKQDCHLYPGRQGRIPDEIWKLKQFPV